MTGELETGRVGSGEAEIRELILRWAKAVREEDLAGIRACHGDEMVMLSPKGESARQKQILRRCAPQDDKRWVRALVVPTHSAKNAEWMGHPRLLWFQGSKDGWATRPFELEDRPVEVNTTIVVNFALNK